MVADAAEKQAKALWKKWHAHIPDTQQKQDIAEFLVAGEWGLALDALQEFARQLEK